MIRTTVFASVAAVCALTVFPATASAADASGARFHIRATVPLFCRIGASFDRIDVADMTGGDVSLGMVTEVCNSANGYTVQANFMNLETGSLVVDEISKPVVGGEARYSHPVASRRSRFWKLMNVKASQPETPIYIRVSISPI